MESKSRGVLDTPLSRGMTTVGRGATHHRIIVVARSDSDEAIQLFFGWHGLPRFARNDGFLPKHRNLLFPADGRGGYAPLTYPIVCR
jgi:hypothetical protein